MYICIYVYIIILYLFASSSRASRRPSSAGVRRPRQPASRGAAGAGRQARQARPRGGSLADDEAALVQAALRSFGAGRRELEEDAERGGAGAASGTSARGAGSIDRDVADVEACLASLQQVRRERLSDMAACERRMELLATRSPQEAADPVQEATEAELSSCFWRPWEFAGIGFRVIVVICYNL